MAVYIIIVLSFVAIGALAEVQITVTPFVNLGQDVLTVGCRYVSNDSAVTDVNSIQIFRNTSAMLGSEASKTVSIVYDRSSNAGLISWQDSEVQSRGNVTGNVDSPESSLLHLQIPANDVLCDDGALYRCTFSVTRSGAPLVEFMDAVITTRGGPGDISFSKSSSTSELFSNATLSLYPANTTVNLICNATVGSQQEPMQLCFNDGSENSGFIPFNMSNIIDSGVMASGKCNNYREFFFEYHLGTNDTTTFLCLVGGNATCEEGIVEGTYTISSAFTTDSERTTNENTVTPITNTQDGTLFTTTEPDTQSEASFSTTEPGTDSEASFSTTKPDTDTEASFSTIEPGTDSEASFSTTEPGTDSETSFSTTQPGTGTESSLDTTEPDVFYTTTETDNDTLFTTNAPDGDNATLFTTETNTESENTENNQTGMFSTVTQPGMVYNGSSTDAELESNATDPNFPENGESTTNNAGFTTVTETSSTFMENTSTNDMNTISSTPVVMENNTAQITATEDFSNPSQAPVTTNSFSTLTDLRFTEEATQTAVASTTQQSAPATEATSVGASDILTSSPFSSIVTSPHTITTVISNISTGPSQEVSGGVSSTSTSSTTVSGSVSTTLSSTTRTTTDSGSVSTTTVSGSVSTTLSSTTRASGSPGASSTIGVGSTVTSSIEQQSRSSALDCNTYLLVVALLLLKNFTVYILNIGVLTG